MGLNLFGMYVEVSDVLSYFGRRDNSVGPFAIVERLTGKALETTDDATNGWQPWLGSLDGNPGQRWTLERSPVKGEILIRSGLNGLALDCGTASENHVPVILWDPHGEAHQRWRLRRTPNSLAWFIASAKDDRVIDMGRMEDRGEDLHPWVWDYHGAKWQQFLVLPMS